MTYRFSPRKDIFDGIFTFLNRISKGSSLESLISITATNEITYTKGGTMSDMFPPSDKTYMVTDKINSSYTFTFKTVSINITGYSIKSTLVKIRYLRKWKLEAKNNDSDWKLLDSKDN